MVDGCGSFFFLLTAMTVCTERLITQSVLDILSLSTFAETPLPILCRAKEKGAAATQSFSINTSTIHLIYMIGFIDLVTTPPLDNDLCLVDRNRTDCC